MHVGTIMWNMNASGITSDVRLDVHGQKGATEHCPLEINRWENEGGATPNKELDEHLRLRIATTL